METHTVEELLEAYPLLKKRLAITDDDLEFVRDLQNIHDIVFNYNWADELNKFAVKWGLE